MLLRVLVIALFGQISLLEISADDSIKPLLSIFGKPFVAEEIPKDKAARSIVELGRVL